jgi:hypothetical protein
MKRKALRRGFPLLIAGIFFPYILSTNLFAQKSLSHVRVVRLSYVNGTVAVKRPGSTEWAKALVNTPIQEGFEISTAASSYAEVEFENGSTARVGELSKLSFDQLAIDETGSKLNKLTFEQGYATFHFLPEHHDSYSVKIAEATVTPNGKSEFRTDLDHNKARVEVFAGSVELAASAKTTKLGKDRVLEFDAASTEIAANQKSGIVKDSWDKWTNARDTQSQLALQDQAVPAARGAMYGWSDLDAYGEWGYFPGFGYGWSPFASMGWAPYTAGMWSFYPGMGYTWIGGEPWGWLPYHYGAWNYSSGFGYFWTPGGFNTWSPALVSWYSGPGWMGWSPLGLGGIPGQNFVTTVPVGAFQGGQLISPRDVVRVPASAGTLVSKVPFEPGTAAMRSGLSLGANQEAAFKPQAASTHNMAPSSILVAGNAGKEEAFLAGHSGHQPLRVRLGTTLGGSMAVGGAVGEFRGDAFHGEGAARWPAGEAYSHNPGARTPMLLPHGQQQSSNSSERGGGSVMQGGGGNVTNSSSAPINSSSHAASAPSAGSGHH